MNTYIGKNKYHNDQLFNKAENHHTWFHILNYSSAHLWIDCDYSDLSKQEIYKIALQLKQNSKFSKCNFIEIIYTNKLNLKKSNTIGELYITGKYKVIKV